MDRLVPLDFGEARVDPNWQGGKPDGQSVNTYRLIGGTGWLVDFEDAYDIHSVWAPTQADYLDLMTTRVPAWLSLGAPA